MYYYRKCIRGVLLGLHITLCVLVQFKIGFAKFAVSAAMLRVETKEANNKSRVTIHYLVVVYPGILNVHLSDQKGVNIILWISVYY